MSKTLEDAVSELESQQELSLGRCEIDVIMRALSAVMNENHHASNAFVEARRVRTLLCGEANRLRKLSALKELI